MLKYWLVDGCEVRDEEMSKDLWKLLFEELEEKMEAAEND